VLAARDEAIQVVVNEARRRVREVAKNPGAYRKLLQDLIVQVGWTGVWLGGWGWRERRLGGGHGARHAVPWMLQGCVEQAGGNSGGLVG
jgi:hypothetical protein